MPTHNAWEKVSPYVLKKCWPNYLKSSDDPDDLILFSLLAQKISAIVGDIREIRGWIENDESLLALEEDNAL